MDTILLDVVDVTVSRKPDMALFIAIASTVVAETLVMLLLKYNQLKKAGLDSLVVNLASVVAGYILLKLTPGLFGVYDIPGLLALLLITIAVELPVLYLLNRGKQFIQTVIAAVAMNIVTYILFWIYIELSKK